MLTSSERRSLKYFVLFSLHGAKGEQSFFERLFKETTLSITHDKTRKILAILSLTHVILMEKEQYNKTRMKDDINESMDVEKDDTSDINEDSQKSSLKKTFAFFKTWSCLLTLILLLIIIIMCIYYFAVTTPPPSNSTDQGDRCPKCVMICFIV